MRDHKFDELNDPMDSYIRRGMKNWAARKQPPTNGRARLLLVASSGSGQFEARSQEVVKHIHTPALRVEQQIEPFNHAWLWVLHLTLNPIRHIT